MGLRQLRNVFFATFLFASTSAFAQLTYVSAVHTTTAQNSITLTLSGNLGAAYTCVSVACRSQWTITFSNPVTNQNPTSVTGVAGTNTVVINFTTPVGIDPVTHKGQTVTITHTTDGIIGAIAAQPSLNARHLQCGDFTAQTFSDASGTCAPVDPSSFMVFSVSPVARNSSHWDMARNTGGITWGSGASVSAINMRETTAAGVTTTDSYFVSVYTADDGTNFNYPSADNVCGYSSIWRVRLLYAPVGGISTNCAPLQALQTQVYASHNNDDTGISTGATNADVLLPVTVANTDQVCQGTNASMTFSDGTFLNCNPQTSPIPTNDKVRWIRVVYGSQDLGSGAVTGRNIPDVHVNGVEVTNSTGVLLYPSGYSPPTYSFAGQAGVPDAFGVVQLSTPVSGNRGILDLITTTTSDFTNQVVGQRFWVRIDYWNTCNPYDGAGGLSVNNKRSIENDIVIVTIPPIATAVTQTPVCNGTTPSNFGITGAAANSTVNWYTAASGGTLITSTTADGAGAATLPITSAPGYTTNLVAGVYTVHAAYISNPAGINCESPRRAVVRTIKERLDLSAANGFNIAAVPTAACPGATGLTMTIQKPSGTTNPPATQPIGGTTIYTWTVPTNYSITSGQNTAVLTYSINTAAVTGSPQATWTYSDGSCAVAAFAQSLTVRPRPSMTSATTASVCSQVVNGPNLTLTSSVASTYAWTIGAITGGVTGASAAGPVTAINQTLTYPSNTLPAGTVIYNVTPTSTAFGCVGATQAVTITVNPKPTVNNQVIAAICSDVSVGANFNGSSSGVATSTYNVSSVSIGAMSFGTGHVAYPSTGQTQGSLSNDQFTNPSAGQVSAVYTVVPVSSAANGSCQGNSFTVTVPVNPEPVMGAISNPFVTVCSRAATSVSFPAQASGAVAASYDITAINLNGLTASAGTPATGTSLAANVISDDAFINQTAADVDVTYTVQPRSAANCLGNAFSIVVRVRPEPVRSALASPFVTVCSDVATATNFPASSSGAATATYNITSLNLGAATVSGGGASTGTGFVAADLADDIFNNVTAANVDVVYTIVPVSASSCPGQPFTLTVRVRPEPVVANLAPAAICSETAVAVNFPASSSGAATATYNINTLNLAGTTVVAGGAATGTGFLNTALADDAFQNITGAVANVVYTVVPVTSAGTGSCQGNSFTVTVPVNSGPSVANQTIGAPICSDAQVGANFNASSNAIAANTYEIVSMNIGALVAGGTVAAAGTTGLAANALFDDTFTNTTAANINAVYTVRPRGANTCPGPTFTVTVTVRPEPVVANMTPTTCSDVPVGINFGSSSSVAAATYNVTAFNAGGLTILGGAPGIVNGLVAADFANDEFRNTTSAPVNVTYTVVPVSSFACSGNSFSITLTVNPEPVGVNAAAPAICSGASVGYNLQTQNIDALSNDVISDFVWVAVSNAQVGGESVTNQSGDIINDVLTNVSGADQTVNYTVTPTSSLGCLGANFSVSVLVRGPTVTIGGAATQSTCSGSALPLTAVEVYTSGSFTTRKWTGTFDETGAPALFVLTDAQLNNILGGGLNSLTPTFNSNGDPITTGLQGQFVLTLTSTDNNTPACTANDVVTINVSQVDANILHGSTAGTVTNPALTETVCNSTNVFLNGNPTGGSGVYNSHAWSVASSAPIAVAIGSVMSGGDATSQTPTFNYTNATNAPVTIVLRYTVVDNAGCNFNTGSNATDISITVNPTPTVDAVGDQALCAGTMTTAVNFASAFNVAGTTFPWTNSNTAIGLAASGAGPSIAAFTATNTTNAPISGTITVTPTANSCPGTPITFTITVNPTPVLFPYTAATMCSGGTFTVTPSNGSPLATTIVPSNTFYTWGAPAIAPGTAADLTGEGAGGGAGVTSISQTITNLTNVSQTLVYTVTPTSGAAGACVGGNFTVTVTVDPLPNIDNRITNICSGGTFNVAPVNGINAASAADASIIVPANIRYAWGLPAVAPGTLADITGEAVASNQLTVSQALVNLTNIPQTVTYTVTPSANSGLLCTGATFTVAVRLDPRPFIDARTQTICSQAAFTIAPVNGINNGGAPASTVIVPAGTTYTWTVASVTPGGVAAVNGESAQAAPQPNISQTLDNQTNVAQTVTYNVQAVSGDLGLCAASATFTATITVSPKPVIGDQVLASICSATAFSLTPANAAPTTIVPAGTTYTWTVVSITPDAGTVNATAQAVPQASIGQTLTNTTNVTQTVRYQVTPVTGSCTGTPFNVDVPVRPRPAIPNQVAAICSGSSFTVAPLNGDPTPATIVPAGISYSWPAPVVTAGISGGSAQAGQASISQTLSTINPLPGTATYTVSATAGGCAMTGTFQVVVTVNPIPALSSTLTPADICSGTFNYTPTSATTGATFDWTRAFVPGINESASLGSGPISETLTNPGTTPVDVTYEFTIEANGCGNIQNVVVRVNPTPVANNILGPSSTCVSPTIDFFYQVTQNAGSTYSWDIPAQFSRTAAGNGATPGGGPGPFGNDYFVLLKFTSATAQNLIVYEKSADGCVSAANILPITVSASPPVGAITGPAPVCKNKTGVTYSVPPNVNSTFVWDIVTGDAVIVGPSAGTNLFQIIVDFGTLPSQIRVIETNLAGCPATYPLLTVAMIDAPIMAGPFTASICSGVQPSTAITLATSPVVASTFTWFVKSITPNISGAFVNDIGSGPLTHAIPLTNNSGSNGTIVYTVTPTATAAPNCMGLPTDYTVTIKPEPVVAAITDQSICPNVLVNGAVSFPFSSNVGGATINWANSNAAIGLAAPTGTGNISFTSAENLTGADIVSTMNVTATAASCTSAGANAKSFTITLKPRPVVSALPNISVCPGDAVSVAAFTSNTAGGETYAWTNDNAAIGLALSGSGNISGYFAPANNSGADRVGNISVIATRNGCAGPAMPFTITIKPQPVVTNVTDKLFCPGDAINIPLTTNVAGAVINWSNSNTLIGLAASDVGGIVGTAAVNNTGADIIGTITVTGTANSCTSTGANIETFTITIKPTPIVDLVTNIVVCSGANVPLTVFGSNISAGGVTFNWTNDNTLINLAASGSGNIASFTAGTNITGAPIVANIEVTGTKNGCSGPVRSYTITVNPEPVVNVLANVTACPGEAISVALTSNVGGATLNWTNTNAAIGIPVSGTGDLNFTAPANNTGASIVGTISVTATAGTCTSTGANSKSFIITIKPTPITNAITNVAVCSGAPVAAINFSANTGGGETFGWTSSNPAVGLAASGSSNIPGYTAPVNTTGAAFVSTITVTATRNLCVGPPVPFTLTVNPEPVVALVTNASVCPTDAVNIPLSSNVAGATLSWTNSNTLIGLAASGTGNITYIAPANNTGSDIVGTISVTASLNGCISAGANAKSFTITIKPTPIVNVVTNITVCSGTTVPLVTFGSNVVLGGVTFNWTNDNTAINLAASGVGNITSFTAATNTTSSSMVANISVTGTKNICVGPVRTFTITILPEPVGTASLKPVCSDEAVAVNLSTLITGGAAASTYNITITNTAGLVASAGAPVDGNGFSATEIQNDKWTNVSGSPHDIVYSIVPVSGTAPACEGDSFDLTVTVNPEPVVNPVANASFCPGDAINIPLTSNVPTATLNWINSNPAIGLGFSGSGDIVYTAPANNTGANITGTITVSGTDIGCTSTGSNIKTFTITIRPTPIVNAVADIVVCSGGAIPGVTFTANTAGGETFDWTNDNTAVGLAAGSSGNITGFTAPVNISGVPIVANVTVTATRSTCVGPPQTFSITVNPQPVVAVVANQSFCTGEAINIPLTSNVPGATITWTNTNTLIGLGATGGGDITYVAPANNTGADIVGSVTVIATRNTCVSAGANAKTFSITIKPTPIVNAVANITVCSGATVPLIAFGSNIGSGGVTFNWNNDNTAINLAVSGTSDIASFTASSNTTSSSMVANITVTGTKNSCTGPVRSFTITVLPEPVGLATFKPVCSDEAVAVNLSTLITGGAAASTYNITITNTAGLVASAGSPVDGSGFSATEIQNDKWTNHTGAPEDIVYSIVPVSATTPACAGDSFDLTITVNPEPVVTAVANQAFCPGDAINIALASNVTGATLNWTNSNPAIGLAFSGSGDITYTAPANNSGANITGTVTVSGAALGCTSTGSNIKSFTITIRPTPIVNTVTNVAVCSGGAIAAIPFSANTAGSEVFNWTNDNTLVGLPATSSGDISAYTAPVNITGVPIVANITVTATRNGCVGPPMAFSITVNPEPVVTAVASTSFCPGDAVNFTLTSNVAGANITWTNTNAAIGLALTGSGDIFYTAPANNTGSDIVGNVTVIATRNSCVSAGANAKTFSITIKPTPIVNVVTNITVCSGQPIAAINFGSNIGSGGVTFNWTNDNTAINLGASGSGNIPGFTAATNTTSSPFIATISVTGVKNSCSGPARTFNITVLPQPVGIPSTASVCSDAALGVNLGSLLTGSAASYGITITNAASLPSSGGAPVDNTGLSATEIQDDRWTNLTGSDQTIIYSIVPFGAGSPGCTGASFDLTVTIKPEPVVAAIADREFCPASPETIALTSNVASAVITWTNTNPLIGLGFTGSGDITYTTPANNSGANITGTITVTAAKDGCTSSGVNIKDFDITIKPTPITNAVADVVVCSGAPIAAISFGANTPGSEVFNWTNDNTAIGVAATGSGTIAAYTAPINISGAPIVANFSVSATRLTCAGPPVTFKITVNPEPVVTAITSAAFCAGDAINIPLLSNVPGATLNWTNSNTSIGILASGTGDIVYTAPANNTGSDITGTIVVTATRNGCLSAGANTKTFTITIKPTPIVNAIADIVVCSGQNVVVPAFGSNVALGGVTFDWTNDNTAINLAGTGTGSITAFTAATNVSGLPMVANISVIGTKLSCAGPQRTFSITINPEPIVTAVANQEFCPGDAINIPLLSNVPGAAITWTNSNASIGIATTGGGDIVYTAPANSTGADFVGTIVVTATKNSCASVGANAKTFTITIKTTPVVNSVTSIVVCSGDPIPLISFSSNADPGVTFNWTNSNTAINLGASGSGNITAFTAATNTGSTPMIANLSVTGTKNSCTGAPMLFSITINPQPVLSVPAPAAICSGEITNITLATNGISVNAGSYRIDLIEYDGAGAPPAGFSFPVSNKLIGSVGGPSHIQSDLFDNTSMLPVVVSYTIVPISPPTPSTPLGCEGAPVVISVTVNPEPTLDPALSPTDICSGETIEGGTPAIFELKSAAGSVAATSFIIRGVLAPGLIAGPTNESLGAGKDKDALDDDSWINTTGGTLSVTYTIAPVAGTCVGPDQTVTVDINPAPAVASGLDRVVCNGATTGVLLQDNSPTSAPAGSYEIVAVEVETAGPDVAIIPGGTTLGLTANAANAALGISASIAVIQNDRYTNTTDDRIVVIYRIVPIAPAGMNSCRGPEAQIRVTVEPPIRSVSVNAAPSICSGNPVSITLASPTYATASPTNPIVTFSYTMVPAAGISGNTVGNSIAEGSVITDILTNTTNADVTVNYKVTPFAAAAANGLGCTSTAEDVFVLVRPLPRANNISNKTICSGALSALSLTSPTYPATPSNIEFEVTIASSDAGITGFPAGVRTMTNPSTINDALVNSSAVTGKVTYQIVPKTTAAGGNCTNSTPIIVEVTVSPRPVITPIANFALCSGDTFDPKPIVTDTESAPGGSGSTLITWSVNTASSPVTGESNGSGNTFSQTLFNNTTDKQSVTYTITARNIANSPTCVTDNPITLVVTVYPNPRIVSMPSSFNVCNGGTLVPNPYVIQSSVAASLNTRFDWVVDDSSNPDLPDLPAVTGATSINETYVNNGEFMGSYQYTISPFLMIPASDNPIMEVSNNTDDRCSGIVDALTVVNVAPAVDGRIFGFDLDGNETAEIFLCRGASTTVNMEPTGLALMEITYREAGVTKTLTKLGGLKQLQVSPTTTTLYEMLTVKDAFGCVANINESVTVNVDAVDNTFSVVGPEIACAPFDVKFQHNQVAGTNYTWKWLDGPDSTTYQAAATVANKLIKHRYLNPSPSSQARFKVQLDAFLDTTKYLAGCRKLPFVKEIRVHPQINAAVFPDKEVICSDEQVSFVNSSQGATIHKWFYRVQGATSEIDPRTTVVPINYRLPNHTTSNPIILEVVYQANNAAGCPAAPVVTPITVYRGVEAAFTHTTPTVFVAGSSVADFTNTSSPVDGGDFRYDWDFGLNATPVNPAGVGPFHVDYSTPGPKEIVLIATNIRAEADGLSCSDEFRETMEIIVPPLIADFTVIPEVACFPTELTVTENLATGDKFQWRVLDNGGLAASSNAVLPVFKIPSPGVYTVELVTTNSFTGGQATETVEVTIYDVPMASFDVRPSIVFAPEGVVETFNFSDGATDYEWDFGDGEPLGADQFASEPKHTYRVEGMYTITLIAKNDHGEDPLGNPVVCMDTLTRKVTAKQGGVTRVPNAFTPNPGGSTQGTSTPGQPGSNSFNDVFLPQVKGAEEFNMQVFDRWGNLIFESNSHTQGWDGYDRNGALMPAGVYVYKLTLRLSDGQRTTQVGDITMIR